MATNSHTFEVPGGNPCTIYGETANINYYLQGDLEPDADAGPTNEQAAVPAHTRRQYPGDNTTIAVSSSTREFLLDPTRRSGSALPGRPFVLLERGGAGEKRQFTFKGRMMDLHAFLRSEAARDMYLYGPSGARYTINEVAAP
jgi:hypothetical protein